MLRALQYMASRLHQCLVPFLVLGIVSPAFAQWLGVPGPQLLANQDWELTLQGTRLQDSVAQGDWLGQAMPHVTWGATPWLSIHSGLRLDFDASQTALGYSELDLVAGLPAQGVLRLWAYGGSHWVYDASQAGFSGGLVIGMDGRSTEGAAPLAIFLQGEWSQNDLEEPFVALRDRIDANASLLLQPLPWLQFEARGGFRDYIDGKPGDEEMFLFGGGGLSIIPIEGLQIGLGMIRYNSRIEGMQAPSTYTWQGQVRWTIEDLSSKDSDGDGVPDGVDRCPALAEDRDGFQDEDGCPDVDNDADGVLDSLDRCPSEAEDIDGNQDQDGCPDLDNDADGIPDSLDQCPDLVEDRDGREDGDGCPDLDNDKDGILDSLDACPDVAEDRDGYKDDDGCPDPDNDGDGIADALDRCPEQPETPNGFQDQDGCPDNSPREQRWNALVPLREMPVSGVLVDVKFDANSMHFKPGSDTVFVRLARQIKAFPNVIIEVRGHSDDRGSFAENLVLSQQQAAVVVDQLVQLGVPPERLRAVGAGGQKPRRSNSAVQGRFQNRRIEIVVQQGWNRGSP